MRIVLPPMNRRRNPLMQALSVLAGLAVIGVLLVFGLIVAGVLLIGGTLLFAARHWKRGRVNAQSAAQRQPDVIEGEYVVIRNADPVAHH